MQLFKEVIPVQQTYYLNISMMIANTESLMVSMEHYKVTDFLSKLSKKPKFYWETSALRTR